MAVEQTSLSATESTFNFDLKYIEGVLQNFENDEKLVVVSLKTSPVTNGDSFTSTILTVEVTARLVGKGYSRKQYHLVAKLAPSDNVRLEMNKVMGLFPRENFMYNMYIPMLIELQKERGVSDVIIPSTPTIFSPPDEKEMVLVFENIEFDGYKKADKTTGCTYEESKLVFKELGRFHALSYAFVQEHKQKFPDIPLLQKYPELKDGLKVEEVKVPISNLTNNLLDSSIKLILEEKENRGECDPELTNKLQKYIGKGAKIFEEICNREDGLTMIILGDCWIKNMMFKYQNGKPVAVKLLNLELSRMACSSFELNYFIYSSIGTEVRRECLTELLDIYYEELQGTWEKINEIVEYTRDDFQREFNSYTLAGFLDCLTVLLPDTITKPPEAANETNNADSTSSESGDRNEVLISRLLDIVDEMDRDNVIY